MYRGWMIRRINKNEKFSVIIVPHDIQKTRTYKISYMFFYVFVGVLAVGIVGLTIFLATYGNLLLKAREIVMLERQVEELTRRNEKIGILMRDLAELNVMEIKVRRLLGAARGDTSWTTGATEAGETGTQEVENEKTQMLLAFPSFWPARGHITRGFSVTTGRSGPEHHPGIDIALERGVPIRAAAAGYVIEAGWDDTYGYLVTVDHGYGIKTLYGHNDRVVVVKDERVGRGQTIAYSGNTGKSSAPHLHFEVIQNNISVDPLKYLLR